MVHSRPHAHRLPALVPFAHCIVLAGALVVAGCTSSFQQIDRRVEALMAETNARMGGDNREPDVAGWNLGAAGREVDLQHPVAAETIPTVNPSADELQFQPTAETDTESVSRRLDRYSEVAEDAMRFDLETALAYAIENSREYRFAEEEFVLASLRLLIERHQWGPRFFNDVIATVEGDGDGGMYDTALNLVNEFRVTQRLPYGGTISARALARATEELHGTVFDDGTASADIVLDADIPLLRGAGIVAREGRIQAERNMIYAAREFERFRREFLFDISRDFLNLVLDKSRLRNSERNVERLEEVEARQTALYRAGRIDRFQAAQAENDVVDARGSLNDARESYRFTVDNFKVRLGMPIEQELVIVDTVLSLPVPDITIDEAVRRAMTYRLDLQNERDRLADAKRAVDNARNDLLPDLDVNASVTIPTDDSEDNAADLRTRDLDFSAGVTFGLPLDREIERLNVRQAQIDLERARRNYGRFRDNIAADVRSAVRSIDAAIFNLRIQERGIEIAQQGIDNIEAAPERANVRDSTDAINDLLRAQDDRDRAYRDLQVSILEYLRDTGQLRVAADGMILPPGAMELPTPESVQPPDPNSSENQADPPGTEPDSDGNFGVS